MWKPHALAVYHQTTVAKNEINERRLISEGCLERVYKLLELIRCIVLKSL